MLDRNRDHGKVSGGLVGKAFEQKDKEGNYHYYNNHGYEINDSGELIEKMPDETDDPGIDEVEIEYSADEDSKGLSFDKIQQDKKEQTEEVFDDFMMVERIKITSQRDPNFVKKGEIIAELQRMNIDHNPKSSRDDLCLMLKEHLGIG